MADAITNSYAIDPAIINCYHAHIYYDDTSRDTAARLREARIEGSRRRDE